MKPAPFAYHVPERADEVVDLLHEYGDEAKILAGGQSLIPMLALRLAVFGHLVDVTSVAGLTGIERQNGSLWVGASTKDSIVEHDPTVAELVPMLALAAPHVGHFQIRNRGTVGGSIAHADPAAEFPAVALALDAEMELLGPGGARTVPAAAFFTGLWSTALAADELLIGVRFPVWPGRAGFAVEEFARRHGDFAIAGACIGIQIDADDRVTRCAVGLIGLGATPARASRAEAACVGLSLDEIDPEELAVVSMADLDSVPADAHGSASYRMRVGGEMVRRAWSTAAAAARNA